ncbi:hypothetical protein [Methanooceanicella nereidis]|nr:hypothetical protein [Methanocella sp. CWC-04]
MSEINCPSCNGSNVERIKTDSALKSFIVMFTDGNESRTSYQCKDCGNKFQIINVSSNAKSALAI